MIESASVHFYKYWSYSALFCCCCRCGVVVLDNCATENCTFNSNMIRHHFAHARSTERCSHLPFGRKILEGLLCFVSFPDWMLRYYNNKNIIFLNATHAWRTRVRRGGRNELLVPTHASRCCWLAMVQFLFFCCRESFAIPIKRKGQSIIHPCTPFFILTITGVTEFKHNFQYQ